MTRVCFGTNRDGYRVEIKGHAGYRPGNDIVCSAVSILCFTLMQCIQDMNDMGKLITDNREYESGHCIVTAYPSKEYTEECKTVFNTRRAGFELLEDRYPDYVSLNQTNFMSGRKDI